MYRKKDIILTGFALFAMLFGAGNLIFPPKVGFDVGEMWEAATLGFFITGIGIPLLAIISAAYAGKDLDDFANRVSPKFSKVFNVVLILAIGPFLALPRTGATAYEMAILPHTNGTDVDMYKYIFLFIYFAVVLMFSIRANAVIERVGKVLTPILIIILAIIIVKGVFFPLGEPVVVETMTNPFKYGFYNGYQTMDTLGAIVFSSIIIKAIRNGRNLTVKQEMKFLSSSSIIAVCGLAVVYGGLLYIGATSNGIFQGAKTTQLLNEIVDRMLGKSGNLILGICVTGACLTTAIGLTATVGDYFSNLLKISYEKIVLFTVVISFIFASFGVDMIVKLAVPVLVFIYPISIVLIALNFFKDFIKNDNTFTGAVIGAGIVSGYETLAGLISLPESIKVLYNSLPLSSIGFAWLIPSIVVGVLFSFIKKK
ncbi:branched-chain amino acid transport system II carrier protein [uncultured Fusobacterium sp.]|uniref:branched-chain amino acid transport system II carrier protein n=1 Tax=uncultured Fusobacterium sp. TaxID=159267 RepID=UPI0025EB85A4|nr:branched-chain amino acid transport system II carrier protein [uncultured Fusobacterium sp.]